MDISQLFLINKKFTGSPNEVGQQVGELLWLAASHALPLCSQTQTITLKKSTFQTCNYSKIQVWNKTRSETEKWQVYNAYYQHLCSE